MIPLAPTLGSAFLSFACSLFVVLRIVIPILPPGSFSSRVPPSEFDLSNLKMLTPADKSYVWLVACDLLALVLFIWQTVYETTNSHTDIGAEISVGGASRLWLALTLRQTCLFVVAGLTLLHVRLGRPVSFGKKHWKLAVPTGLLVITSTSIAAVLAGARKPTLFVGLLSYTGTLAVLSTAAWCGLVGTLLHIRRNLARLNAEAAEPAWPPASALNEPTVPRAAHFKAEDIEKLKDGGSWITSPGGSRRESLVSAFSFSTRDARSRRASGASSPRQAPRAATPSLRIKSTYRFPGEQSSERDTQRECAPSSIPPVIMFPENLAGSCSPTSALPAESGIGAAASYLPSETGVINTMTAWSYPKDVQTVPRSVSVTPFGSANSRAQNSLPTREMITNTLLPSSALSPPARVGSPSAQVFDGCRHAPKPVVEKATVSIPSTGSDTNVLSIYRAAGWLVTIWVSAVLSFPYMLAVTTGASSAPQWAAILMILSVTLSSPVLAVQLLLNSPLPIPSDLFDDFSEPPSVVHHAPSSVSSMHEYKRSGSVTVFDGRRSGDVWLANGEAIDAQNKLSRAFNMILSKPKLSVMSSAPMKFDDIEPALSDPAPRSAPPTFTTETSKGEGHQRKESHTFSYYSDVSDEVKHA